MAEKKQVEWLRREVDQWVRDGVVSEAQKAGILGRYPSCVPSVAWGTIIFSSLGAVIAGLGVILLLAYNWTDITKFQKLTLVLGSVLIAHLVGLHLFRGEERRRPLGEGLCLLGTMLFGAGIWLVAQIYHIDEHFPNAFLIWGVGALAMAITMPSIPQAILAAILFVIWSGVERVQFYSPMYVAPVLLALVIIPLAYLRRSRLLLAVAVPGLVLSYAFAVPRDGGQPWLVLSVLLSLSALMIAKSYHVRIRGSFPEASGLLAVYGWGLYIGILYLMSFPRIAHEFFGWDRSRLAWSYFVYWGIPLVACAATWILLARDWVRGTVERREGELGVEIMLVPMSVILAMADLFYLRSFGNWVVAGPFNLVLIGLAASLMAIGCRRGISRPTLLGSVLLILVIVARYFDLFDSLLIRGVIFVGMGALLLVEGVVYSRAKKQKAAGGVS